MTDIRNLTIKDVKDSIAKGEFSAEELYNSFQELIAKEDKELNSYISTIPFREYEKGNLHGVPLAIKDNILIEGAVATAASKILENYISAYDATVIKNLKKEGASFLGKTNLDEFAMGASTENSAFGATKNPHDKTRVAGGSSGGSAAAVSAGLAVAALGSDTGGSIRNPASFCGVVGLKPSYGRVSRHGLIAMASSLDQVGPITKNVYDSAILMNVIAGHDEFDSTSAPVAVPDYTNNLPTNLKGITIGVPKEFFGEGLKPEVASLIKKAIEDMQSLNANIVDVSLPHSEYAVPAYYIIAPCEISSNMARYDGIRYGKSEKGDTLLDVYEKSRAKNIGPEVQRRIMLGTYALSAGYYDAYYLKAMKVKALIKKDFDNAFKKCDVIVGPTTPDVAFKIGEKANNPIAMYLEDVYTGSVNLAGLPAMSLPCGNIDGLPVGLQIIGRQFDEKSVINTGYAYELSQK